MNDLIDSHCHLDFPHFEGRVANVMDDAAALGVVGAITICTRVRQFDHVLNVARADERIACSVGTHPHYAAEEADVTVEEIVALCEDPNVVAIGEAGLDYHYDHAPHDVQAAVFRTNIEASRRTGLPLVVHARSADDDMARILREEHGNEAFPFVLHCFSSGPDLARIGIELGGYVSFSGIVTFKASETLRSLAAELPLDRILVETDAPYLAPVPHRGKTNEPGYTAHTAGCTADARGMDADEFAAATRENTLRLFSKLPESFGRV